MIEKDFENFENFKTTFISKSVSQFASGWSWLILNDK
jgi:superoxide dismutase